MKQHIGRVIELLSIPVFGIVLLICYHFIQLLPPTGTNVSTPITSPPVPWQNDINVQMPISSTWLVPITHDPFWGSANIEADPYIGYCGPGNDGFFCDGGSTISPDGTYVIMYTEFFNPTAKSIELINMKTGKTIDLIKKFHFPINENTPWLKDFNTVFWDPVDAKTIYAGNYRLSLIDGTITRILYSRDQSFCQPTPDGKWLPMMDWKKRKTFLLYRPLPLITNAVQIPFGYMTISPDGSYIQGVTCNTGIWLFKVNNHKNIQEIHIQSANTHFFQTAHWLPDSSGYLMNSYNGELSTYGYSPRNSDIWKVTTTGQVSRVTCNALIVASSDNGRHWLFLVDGKYYLVHTK